MKVAKKPQQQKARGPNPIYFDEDGRENTPKGGITAELDGVWKR